MLEFVFGDELQHFYVTLKTERELCMKKGRILKGLLFSAAFAFAVITAGKINAKADTAINVNQEYNLVVPRKTGIVATFTIPSDCTIQFEAQLTKPNLARAYAQLWVNGTEFDLRYFGYGEGKVQSNKFVFQAGTVGVLRITGNQLFDTAACFKIIATPVANVEKENNDSPSSATPIKLKKTYVGTANNNKDTDWFVFKAPKTGNYKFTVANTQPGGTRSLYVEGYKNKNKKDRKFSVALQTGARYTSKKIHLKKGKKYYIRFNESVMCFGTTYEIKATKCRK